MQGVTHKKNGSRFGSKNAKWKIGTLVKKIDLFGKEVPSFNLKGETKINTLFGGLITVIVLACTLAYAILKGIHLVNK